jgi:20S proteasome alpha/beta subunit
MLDLANVQNSVLNNSIIFDDDINIDISDNLTSEEELTTVIAIKCNEGIIIATDSQATAGDTKNLMASKIFEVNKNIGIGCAGVIGHIDSLVDKMKEKLSDELMSDAYTRKNIIDVLRTS